MKVIQSTTAPEQQSGVPSGHPKREGCAPDGLSFGGDPEYMMKYCDCAKKAFLTQRTATEVEMVCPYSIGKDGYLTCRQLLVTTT